jgi:hypothetical protein
MKINPTPRRLLAALVLLTASMLACVSVQSTDKPAGSGGSQSQPQPQPKNDSGFSVSETTVPDAPAAGATAADGFTISETVVPEKYP